MKKVLFMLTCLVGVLSACNKDKTLGPNNPGSTLPITFKPDSSVLDRTIQEPKNNQLVFSGIFNTGSINGFSLSSIKVTLKQGGDAASPVDYLRKIRYELELASGAIYAPETKDSVFSATFSFSNFVKNYPQYQNRSLKIYADILSSATNNTGAEDNLVVSVQLTYTGFDGTRTEYFQTSNVDGHKTIFSVSPQTFTLASVADPATPTSGVILDGQEKPALSYFVKLTGVSGNVTEHRLLVQGQAANAVTSLKLFDGANNFITQANVSGGVVTIVTSDAVSAGTQKSYVVKPVVSVTTGDVSNYDFIITLDAVKAVSTVGEQKTDNTDRAGSPFMVYKSMLTVNQILLPTTAIIDSVWMDAYKWTETASSSGQMRTKQHCFKVQFADNGIQDTLQLVPQLLDGVNDITASVYFTNQNGDTVTYLKKTDTRLYFVSKTGGNGGQMIVPTGATKTYTLRLLPRGFKHPGQGDGYAVGPIFSQTRLSPGYKYIVRDLPAYYVKMSTTQASGGSAQVQPWIVSDVSSPSNNGVFQLSSNDWFELVVAVPLPDQVYAQN